MSHKPLASIFITEVPVLLSNLIQKVSQSVSLGANQKPISLAMNFPLVNVVTLGRTSFDYASILSLPRPLNKTTFQVPH